MLSTNLTEKSVSFVDFKMLKSALIKSKIVEN